MLQPWVKWMIKHNLKFLVIFVWLILLPLFWLAYVKQATEQATEDAMYDLNYIKNTKKEDL
jgi:hypothetical protein